MFERKKYETKSEKVRDFWIGAGLFVLLNMLMFGVIIGLTYGLSQLEVNAAYDQTYLALATAIQCIGIVAMVVNLAVIVYLFVTRLWMGIGYIMPLALLLALATLISILFVAVCFIAIATSGG